MELGIKTRRALVLGASRGLGFGVAKALAPEVEKIMIVARDESRLRRAVEEIRQLQGGTGVSAFACDFSDCRAADAIADAAAEQLGHVDILVNNTGGPPPGPITGVSADLWRAQFEAMVLNVYHLTGRVLPGMRDRGWGRILTITSSGVIQPIPSLGISNALRSAIIGWSKTLANEVAADGITVNCLAPGRIRTSRTTAIDRAEADRRGRPLEEVEAASVARIPLGRYGTTEEFGAVGAFLASARASYVTGSVIRVDGGLIGVV